MTVNTLKPLAPFALLVLLCACAGPLPTPPNTAPYTPTQCGAIKTDAMVFLTKACDSQLQSGGEPVTCGPLRDEIAKVISQVRQEPARIMAAQRGNDCPEPVMAKISADMDNAMQTLNRYQAAQLDELIPKQCARIDFRTLDALSQQCEQQLGEPGKSSTKTACISLAKEFDRMAPVLDKADAQNRQDPQACSHSAKMINAHVGKALKPVQEYHTRTFDENPTW